jgi:hypothetical protein
MCVSTGSGGAKARTEDPATPSSTAADILADRHAGGMWIRSLRWRPNDRPDQPLRGAFMPAPGRAEVDTAELDAAGLRDLLPASGGELAEHGRLIVELVVEDAEQPAELEPILEVCAPFAADDMASYVMLPRPISSFSQFRTGPELVGINFRGLAVTELAFDQGSLRDPRLIGRPVRIFDTRSLLVVCWRPVWAYPSMPPPRGEEAFLPTRELPGEVRPPAWVAEAIERGTPEHQARFATEWGGGGPRRLDDALGEFDMNGKIGPGAVGEALFSGIARDLAQTTRGDLTVAHEQWELDLQSHLTAKADAVEEPIIGRLARFGAIANLLEEARGETSEPHDHSVPYWFEETTESATIRSSLVETEAVLERFGETLRNSIGLASAVSAAAALRLQQQTQRQSEGLQAAVTTISSLVLGPALVFGIYGANVPLPLGGTWAGFGLMALLAVASAFAIRFVLERMAAKHADGSG